MFSGDLVYSKLHRMAEAFNLSLAIIMQDLRPSFLEVYRGENMKDVS